MSIFYKVGMYTTVLAQDFNTSLINTLNTSYLNTNYSTHLGNMGNGYKNINKSLQLVYTDTSKYSYRGSTYAYFSDTNSNYIQDSSKQSRTTTCMLAKGSSSNYMDREILFSENPLTSYNIMSLSELENYINKVVVKTIWLSEQHGFECAFYYNGNNIKMCVRFFNNIDGVNYRQSWQYAQSGSWTTGNSTEDILIGSGVTTFMVFLSYNNDNCLGVSTVALRDDNNAVAYSNYAERQSYFYTTGLDGKSATYDVDNTSSIITSSETEDVIDVFGNFDDTSDTIDIPNLPLENILNSGFVTAYQIDNDNLSKLSTELWSTDFIDTIYKNYTNPFGAIIDLYQISTSIDVSTSEQIKIGNYLCANTNGQKLTSQFKEIDCGSLSVNEYFATSLDYNPYTKISLYLPYVGIVPLNIDLCNNSVINIKYHINLLNGDTIVYVKYSKNKYGTNLQSVLNTYSTNVITHVPITGNDNTNRLNTVLKSVMSIGVNVASGNVVGGAISTIDSALNTLLTKENYQKTNSLGGVGILGIKKPYLIIERPIESYANNMETLQGFTTNKVVNVSNVNGFSKFNDVKVTSTHLTIKEIDELKNILESGVFL